MATVLLSAAGAAVGSSFGGSVLGLSGAVIGRAIGGTVGRSLDQRLLGGGSETVEAGKIDRFRLTGASYGSPVNEIWGRMRISGEVIWASRFHETRQQSGGGKGSSRTSTATFSYTVSLAIALCKGKASNIGRIWADGVEIPSASLDIRFYSGDEDQLPDAKIEAVEGIGFAPSYRGICYVVIEDLPMGRFGNRVPQFSFEVFRNSQPDASGMPRTLSDVIRAVALIPGTGEYSLATTPVHFKKGPGLNESANIHTVNPETDFSVSLRQLRSELPNCGSVSLVVSWFGDDLRCANCSIRPKVDQSLHDGVEMPWLVSGIDRASAGIVSSESGSPAYGGTPADRAVVEAIQAIRASGKEVMFYPFILMDQLAGNGLADPWSDSENQPVLPWRGRITLNRAPGRPGTADQTSAADAEVNAFLGNAEPSDFMISEGSVDYSGQNDWGYRRFVLHYAHLCALAGGVDSFCIGSEMRGLTQIRGESNTFPFVSALVELAAEVKAILGNNTRISYAADWSEYFGLHADGDVLFNLDSLWASDNIDFIGIDNYMPISDWREGLGHADEEFGTVYNTEYLKSGIRGGEGFDWYYESAEAEEVQRRSPILDSYYGEDWVFRYKDLNAWWSNQHFNRIGGIRQASATAWVPESKPIVFTEYGCSALHLATNQPNKFLDPKSSESGLPRGSSGHRDDYLQVLYFLAMDSFWRNDENNPLSALYPGRMIDLDRSHAWAWDARPFPEFPGNRSVWSDSLNYDKGHWLNGRSTNQQLRSIVSEICSSFHVDDIDVDNLHGVVRGYQSSDLLTGRGKLQPLLAAMAVDVAEVDGELRFSTRDFTNSEKISESDLVSSGADNSDFQLIRESGQDLPERARFGYLQSENDFEQRVADAIFPGLDSGSGVETEMPLLLTANEAYQTAERFLVEARSARDTLKGSLPPSRASCHVGTVIDFKGSSFRIDMLEDTGPLKFEATRIEPLSTKRLQARGTNPTRVSPAPVTPVFQVFLDLPLLRGDETPFAPHVAVSATPWPGPVSVWSSSTDDGYTQNIEISSPAVVGETQTTLLPSGSATWDRGSRLRVFVPSGNLSSASQSDVLNGANTFAIGDGTSGNWEVAQFRDAVLVGNGVYEVSHLIRGLGGTDATGSSIWPAGSIFVLLDGTLPQIDHPISLRGLERFYRVGPTALGYADQNVSPRLEAFAGNGLRPLSVSHLRQKTNAAGGIDFSWIRRSRIDADSWSAFDIPLGEETESYIVSIIKDSEIIRQTLVSSPTWTYSSTMQTSDGISSPFIVDVSQISASFGPGPAAQLQIG